MNNKNDNNQLDTKIEVVTPENIRFSYRLAGPLLRMHAYIFDFLFMVLFFVMMFFLYVEIIKYLPNTDSVFVYYINGFLFVLSFLVYWFGNALLESVFNGQTFGKMIMGIRVLTIDGQPIHYQQAILRNIIRTADFVLGPFLILFMGCNSKMMRLGDIAARTMVVMEESEKKNRAIIRFKHPEIKTMIERIPADFEISPELSRALSVYVHRRIAVSQQRRWEIAYPLSSRLTQKMKWANSLNPDLVLCSIHQWNLDQEK